MTHGKERTQMTEKDFVTAWMLAHRAANPDTIFSDLCNRQLMTQAKQLFQLIEQEYPNEADSRTED